MSHKRSLKGAGLFEKCQISFELLAVTSHLPLARIVIPSEARDLQFAAKCRSLASLGMTKSMELRLKNDF
jgi:hypothetical protein